MIIPQGFGQVNYRFSGAGLPTGGEVTFGFELEVGAPVLPADVAVAFGTLWQDNVRPVQPNVIQLEEVYVKFGPNQTGADGIAAWNTAGALTGATSPPSLAVLVKKVTVMGGRRGRGRAYWPGIPEAEIDEDGSLSGAHLGAWQSAMNNFFSDAQAANLPLYVLHSDGITSTPGPSLITALAVQSVAGTQRQRMRR